MSRPAEMADYNRLVADHPTKLTVQESGYLSPRQNNTGHYCEECLHFYTSKAARNQVCEIVRRPNSEPIEKTAVCKFWTRTGTRFPLYDRLGSEHA